jgi:hypothetical protein
MRALLLSLLASGLGVLGAVVPARAAQIRGTVRDGGGSSVAGARITVVRSDTSVVREVRSASNGTYVVNNVPSGTWQIGASRLGLAYSEATRSVGTVDLVQDFTLGPDVHPGRWTTIGNTDPENLYATDSGSLLPDGRIFYCHDTQEPVVFDPVSRTKSFPSASPSEQGCHIPTLLEDGRLLFVGGQGSDDFRDAVRTVKTYDYANGGWLVLPELYEERWYPGLARLADGRLLVMGGGQKPNAQRTATCEIFDPSSTTWTRADSMNNPTEYPPSVLLYTGRVLRSWWPPQLYDPSADAWRDTGSMVQTNRLFPGHCDHSLVLLADGRACAVGIYRGMLSSPSMIELYNPATETWTLGATAATTRSQPEVVMLPTGQVCVAGGKLEDPGSHVPTNQYGQTKLTDIYDAGANTWRRCADMTWFREYHAVTVLVPDGRVVTTAGTGPPAGPGVSNDIEAFEPPYLFRGVRPRIDSLSTTTLQNGTSCTLRVSRTDSVTRVVLIGTNAVTHWVDGGVPRVVSLPFTQGAGAVSVFVPASRDTVPVGYYILFVLVDDIPSVGRVVRVISGETGVPRDEPPRSTLARGLPSPGSGPVLLQWYQLASGVSHITVLSTSGTTVYQNQFAAHREGWHALSWNGRDRTGRRVPAGVYWLRVESPGGGRATARIVRLE